MSFADQLKQERERLGITQAQAASLIEVPARTYWEWEAEKTTPYAITQEGGPSKAQESEAQAKAANADPPRPHTRASSACTRGLPDRLSDEGSQSTPDESSAEMTKRREASRNTAQHKTQHLTL